MKAVYLTGIRRFSARDIPPPGNPAGADVLVRVRAVGICGSDVHYYLHGSTGSDRPAYPFIIGHECSGEVVSTGPKARFLKPGDRVFVEPNVPCHGCDMCASGNFNLCRKPKFLGYPGQMEGALRELVVMPAENLFRFRKELAFGEAMMAEPLSVALYALFLSSKLRIRTAAVLGTGSIGLCLVKAMRACREKWAVFSSDIVERRCELGRANGAGLAVNASAADAAAEILQATGMAGVDAVFECAGKPATLDQALSVLKPGGTLFVIGIPDQAVIRLDADLFRKKGITVTYVRRQNRQSLKALRLIEAGLIGVKDIVGPEFGFDEAREAFELKVRHPGKTVKPVLKA
jgi:L-iditol 2-dehydrogenase